MTMPSSSPEHTSADAMSSYRAIENLIYRYAELVDTGDFAGLDALLADATFSGGSGPVRGKNAIEQMFTDTLIVYDDGTPRTKHITTNIAVEVNEEAGTAVSRAYFTTLQSLPELPLQAIASGRYNDRFERLDGWRFVERRVQVDLIGDLSHHLRRAAADR
jgi:3-phenylpropionate/cinnamic acid dioxygenase small subunit